MYAIPPAPNVVRRLECPQTVCDPHPRQHKLSMYNNNSSWSNVGVPCLGQAVVLALACIAACQTPVHAQSSTSKRNHGVQKADTCPPVRSSHDGAAYWFASFKAL